MKTSRHAAPSRLGATSRAQSRRPRSIVAATIVPVALLLVGASAPRAFADAILAPSDPILGGQLDVGGTTFDIGVTGTTPATNNWPGAEAPLHIIDGVAQKYLNFGITNTGFLVNPSFNAGTGSVVTSIQLWTANDGVERDPSSYQIFGTNDPLDFGQTTFDLSLFTSISSGNLALPDLRNGGGSAALNPTASQTVTFTNTQAFKEYLIIFPTVKNAPGAANSMQIAEVQLFGSYPSAGALTWTGSVDSIWNIGTTANWDSGGGSATFVDTSSVTFDDTANPARTNITVQTGGSGVQVASTHFQNSTLNYTINGDAITSPGTQTKDGTGSVTLNNLNSYAAGTTVNAGTLNVGASGTVGSATDALRVNNPEVNNPADVTVNFNSAQAIGSLSGTIAEPFSGTHTATINLNGDLTVTQSTAGTFEGVIAGTGGLIKAGPGTLTLTGANTYAGATTVNGGTLVSAGPSFSGGGALPAGQPVIVNNGVLSLGADEALGTHSSSVSSLTVNGGTVSAMAGTASILPATTLNGGTIASTGTGNFVDGYIVNYALDGTVTTVAAATPSTISAGAILLRNDPLDTGSSAPVTFNVPRGTASADLVVFSVISDNGAGLIKSGNGIMTLKSANTYSGPTVINAGRLVALESESLGTGDVLLNSGGTLSLGAPRVTAGFGGFSLNGGATTNGANSVLTLTTNAQNQARSAFTQTPVSIDSGFTADFTYTAAGDRLADGITFTVQNSSPTALGAAGGSLGYGGIPASAAVQFNLYTGGAVPQPIGTNFAIGTTGTYLDSAPVNLASGNPINVHLTYNPSTQELTEMLTDTIAGTTYSNTFTGVDLASAIGSNAGYVGFTGGTGGQVATQTVGDFSLNNFAPGATIANAIAISAGATSGLEVLPESAGGAGAGTIAGAVSIGANATVQVTGGPAVTDTDYLLTISGDITLAGDATIDVANNGTGVGTAHLQDVGASAGNVALTKTGAGTLVLAGAQTYQTLNANAGTTDIQASQTLGALNIGDGAVVTLTAGVAPSPALGEAAAPLAVPEPSSIGLLLLGGLGLTRRHRSARGVRKSA